MKLNAVCFTVTGRGRFPIDMLRYDCCYPVEGIPDIEWSQNPEERRREFNVRLVRHCKSRGWTPTIGRWSSFGWSVDMESITDNEL